MAEMLSEAQLAHFRTEGYVQPLRLMSAAEAATYRERIERLEAERPAEARRILRQKCHLVLTWASDLVRHPRLLDAVEQILGPDILVWSTSFFIKDAHDPHYVSWHQDPHHWGLASDELVSAWIALTPATPENGCMQYAARTHLGRLPHIDRPDANNMLTRGQTVDGPIDPACIVDAALAPGEATLFDVVLAHSSPPNPSGQRRIGLAVRYMRPDNAQIKDPWDSAMLVRGEDAYENFELEPAPERDLDPASLDYLEYVLSNKQGGAYRQGKMIDRAAPDHA